MYRVRKDGFQWIGEGFRTRKAAAFYCAELKKADPRHMYAVAKWSAIKKS